MKDIKKCITVVLGGQAGSEGKGKIAGYLAKRDDYNVSVCNFMPNAGHTWVSDDGDKVMVQQLPQAVIQEDTVLMISAGSAIQVDLLLKEIEKYDASNRLIIHPRAMIIEQKHRDAEAKALNKISSTLKGCGYASADKVVRADGVILAKDCAELEKWVLPEMSGNTDINWYDLMQDIVRKGYKVIVEAPQGFDLDINHGLEYPYCTSRQTTTTQVLADAGLPPQALTEVIAVIRPYPIRVGNVYDENGNMVGTSGGYRDSKELTWEYVAEQCGMPREEIVEYTTVTGKLRRVFEPNWARLKEMCFVNGVTGIALNFANYIDYSIQGKNKVEDLTPLVMTFISKVERETGVPVVLIGTGAKDSDMIDLR